MTLLLGVYCRSRLQTLFQQLEKIGGKQARNQTSTEDLQTIRYVTSKIHQILNSQGRPSPPTNTHPHPLIIADPHTYQHCCTRSHPIIIAAAPWEGFFVQDWGKIINSFSYKCVKDWATFFVLSFFCVYF